MKELLVAAAVVLIHGAYATLVIKGPTKPVVDGETVVLECVYTDSEHNISQVHFEVFSQYMQMWHEPFQRMWCRSMMSSEQIGDSLFLTIPHVWRYGQGPFRCVSDAENVTAPDNASQPLAFKVHYVGSLSLTRDGYTSYLGVPQVLKVQRGEEVVLKCLASASEELSYFWHKKGSDWILPNSTLTLRKVSEEDEGEYTCMVEHPTMASLNKKRSVRITVLPEDASWYETSNGRLILMTSAAAAALLVFVISASVFLCRRAKQARTCKGPIDDHSQKKPIYRGSSESLASTCGDKQPLV